MIRASAGTASPPCNAMTSPETSCSAVTMCVLSSRSTRAVRIALPSSDAIVCSVQVSDAKPMALLRAITARTITASSRPPVSSEMSAVPASSATGRLANWDTRISKPERVAILVRKLPPCRRRAAFAAARVRPAGRLSRLASTAWAVSECQRGPSEMIEGDRIGPRTATSRMRRSISSSGRPGSNRINTCPVEVLADTERMPLPPSPASSVRFSSSSRRNAGSLKRARPRTAT